MELKTQFITLTLIITNTTEKSHIGDQIWKQAETHLLTALLL